MSELRPIVLGIGHGLKDSLLGMTVLLRLNSILEEKQTEDQFKTDTQSSRRTRLRGRQNDLDKKADRSAGARDIYSKMLQCCMLNGGIFWMSIFLFENYILPGLQFFTHFIFNTLVGSAPHQGLWLWRWMGPLLSYLFGALWVLPLFWLSKPLNSLWYQEIADSAYRNTRGRPLGFLASFKKESVSSHISKTVADFFFSFLLQVLFLVQAMVVGFLPIVGPVVSLAHMCLLYSLYSFEYKWVNMGWPAPKRLTYMECNWPYFVGFGLPLAVLTSLAPSIIISGCVFAILFPLFIISGNQANVVETNQVPIRLFYVVVRLTNKILMGKSVPSRSQSASPDSTVGT
ncbi:etoposide-induced protein 2.4 homolog [Stylophora pistillata]|uniref:etoposide-induced protein 2.4 homolog n=1 Tax=Stylophora pistillata TaxID=50429 RepID=UPI000C048769|nr:etoposide-induced protein 2.4 homolog [Stylophora pistillata]